MTRQLEPLREHSSRCFSLTPEEAQALRASALGLRVEPWGSGGDYLVKSRNLVGTDVVGGVRATVVPKLPVARLLYLLCAYPEGLEPTSWTQVRQEEGALKALTILFAAALDAVFAHGLPAGYKSSRDDLQYVRGTLDVMHLATVRFGLFPPLRCSFQEHSPDIEPNRRLLAAARLLVLAPDCEPNVRERLRAHAEHLADLVSVRSYGPDVRPLDIGQSLGLQLGLGVRPYRAALDLATVILRNSTVDWQGKETGSLSFVVDMDKAFERFVCRSLARLLAPAPDQWLEEPSRYLDRGNHCLVQPDAVWCDAAGKPRIVIDAKWKTTEAGQSIDIKQLVIYCTALGLTRGVLIYGSSRKPTAHHIRHSSITIHVLGLPLDGSIAEVDQGLAELAETIASLVKGPALGDVASA